MDLGKDVVEKGAFKKTIRENKGRIPLLWQHDHRNPIGYLDLKDKDEGLWVKGNLLMDNDVPEARKAYKLIKSGIVRGMSIGFKTMKDEVTKGVRRLKELALYEGSIVTFPMLPAAHIQQVKAEMERMPFAALIEATKALIDSGLASPEEIEELTALISESKAVATSEGAAPTSAEAGDTPSEAGDTLIASHINLMKSLSGTIQSLMEEGRNESE